MPDSFRTDGSRAVDDAPDAERDARIEELLLAGLDHYFLARYEQAINVWTRALFFDRSHARARAYIERARSALAERARQSEELLQSGVAALDRGHGHEARRLLQAAVEQGARADDVHPLLDRLNRQPGGGAAPPHTRSARPLPSRAARKSRHPATASAPADSRRPWLGILVSALLLAGLGAAAYSVAAYDGLVWRSIVGTPDPPINAAASPAMRETQLPLPRRGEMALGRARALAARGQLHEALAALDVVRFTDPEKLDADRVRSDIQHQLLQFALPARAAATAPEQAGGARQP